MRKLTPTLIFILLFLLLLPTVTVFADVSDTDLLDTVTESVPSSERYLDFSEPLTEDDASFVSFTPKTGRAATEVVRTADGGAYYRLAHFDSELDTAIETTFTNISHKTDLEDMSYVVIEYDMASDGTMYDGFYMFPMARDKNNSPSSKGKAKITLRHNADGTLYAESSGGEVRYLGEDSTWHNYTWIFEVVSYSPVNTVMDAHVYIDGEYFTSFRDWIDPANTRYFSMIRLNAPLTAKAGEGIILDNVRARAYANDYEGGLDKLLDGTYSTLSDWEGASFGDGYVFTGEGAYAKIGDTYYSTVEAAIAAAEEGGEITVLRTPDYPVFVDKSVTLLSAGESFKFSSFTHKGVYNSEDRSLTFTEAEDGDKISVTVDGEALTYAVGSYPVYKSGGMLASYEKDGALFELMGYAVNGTAVTDTLSPLTLREDGITVTPSYKEVQPLFAVEKDSKQTVYYYYTDLYNLSKELEGGETVRLLSDLTAEGGMPTFKVASGKSVNFDFNGHSVKCEVRTTFFTVSGDESLLNVYSSKAGATFFGKTRGENTGSTFLALLGGGVCNIGNYGDHSGDNLSVYTATLVHSGGLGSSSIVNVNGGSYYKNIDFGDGFVTFVAGGSLNVDGALLAATKGTLNFDLAADGIERAPSSVTIKNSSLLNLDTVYEVVDTLPLDSSFRVENSLCYKLSYKAAEAIKGDEGEVGVMVFDRFCTYDAKVKSSYAYLTLSEGMKDYALVNRTPKQKIIFNTYGDEQDYTLVEYGENVKTGYIFVDENSEVVDIDWDYFGKTTSEVWLRGEIPVAPFEVPENAGGIVYSMPEVVAAEQYAYYSVSMERDFDIYMNLNLYSSFDINIYLPVAPEYSSVTFAGATVDLSTLDQTTLNGTECYILTKSALAYSDAGTDITLVVKLSAVEGNTLSNTLTVSTAQYLKTVKDGSDFSAEDKNLISELVIYIDKKYTDEGKTCPPKIKELIAVQI